MATTVGGLVISDEGGELHLLDDKLEIPGLGLAVSRRARIDELMEQAARHRITLVTGPAGAGKTVACAGWAASWAAARSRAPRPGDASRGHTRSRDGGIGWLTLDAGDREPVRFWQYMISALERAGAISQQDADQLSGRVLMPGEMPQQILAAIADSIADRRAVLVLDDVHELAGSEVLPGLDELVHHAPAGLTLVLAGRFIPGLALAKLRVSGQLGDLGPADLACTSQEAEDYLTALEVPDDPSLRAAIRQQAEGWMAGLRLLSMAVQSPAAAAEVSADAGDLATANELITDYVSDEILTPLAPATREFLLRTSLTEVIPPDLAHELTGDSSAAARLEQLSRENGLVNPAGPSREDYRYHPMLRSVLEAELRREYPDDVPVLLRKVARWHAARDELMAAIRAAVRAGDWDFGVHVLTEASPLGPPEAGWAELEEILGAFPPGRRSNDAVLASALAAARLWQGDPDGAMPHLDCAESALAVDLPADDARGDAQAAEVERAAARQWLAALQVMRLASTSADLANHWSLASRAHEKSSSAAEHRGTGLLWLALGCASLRRLDVQAARSALQHAGSQLAAGGLFSLRERARSWEAVALAWYGDLATATRIAAEVAQVLDDATGDLAPILAISQARVHVARDEPEAASILLDQADEAAGVVQPAGEPVTGMLTGMVRARIAIDEGNAAGARGLVRLLTETAAGEPRPAVAIAVLDAEISLAAGELGRARATLAGLGTSRPSAADSAETICRARLLMADDDDKGALKLLEPVLSGPVLVGPAVAGRPPAGSVSPAPRPGGDGSGGHAGPAGVPEAAPVSGRLWALLTAVIAHRRLNQAAEAAERLEEALALAEPDDQSGAFISAGTPIRSALTVLVTPASRCATFASRILDRFDGRLPRGASQPTGTPLTESELAVLRFLPSHMTNQEIAESLFLSINTIKTHLSSVYRKLGVTSRRQAIAQGRRLDLL